MDDTPCQNELRHKLEGSRVSVAQGECVSGLDIVQQIPFRIKIFPKTVGEALQHWRMVLDKLSR